MLALKIHQCSDPMMWYRDLVGETVCFLGCDVERGKQIYWSRELAGYKNFVWAKDAEVVELETDPFI